MARLTVTGTPIDGNWRQLDPRILTAIAQADLLIAEERKNALRFLTATGRQDLGFILINEHSSDQEKEEIVNKILAVENTVFISDAGTPCVADPDYRLVDRCIRKGISIRSVPGPSSIITALSVSGFPTDRFTFLGFPPKDKTSRKEFFTKLATTKITTVFLERPYALKRTLEDLSHIERPISLCIGLGTEEETNLRGKARELLEKTEGIKNAFAVVISPAGYK